MTRIAVLSDVHGNLVALEAVVRVLRPLHQRHYALAVSAAVDDFSLAADISMVIAV